MRAGCFTIILAFLLVSLFACQLAKPAQSSAASSINSGSKSSGSSKSAESVSSAASDETPSLTYPAKAKNNGKDKKNRDVFIIGDSISEQYGPFLQIELENFFGYARKKGKPDVGLPEVAGDNGRSSAYVLGYLNYETGEASTKYDILAINCGIHDISNDKIPLNDYIENLKKIITVAKANATDVVWITTTPAKASVNITTSSGITTPFNKEVLNYNYEAAKLMIENDIYIIDLYSLTKSYGPVDTLLADEYHFNAVTQEKQAKDIARILKENFYNYDLNR